MSSVKKQAIKGTIWTFLGYGGSQILRFGGNLILTRLLAPELFGLMAIINTFLIGLELFSDLGIAPSIIRSERGDDPKFLNTAWTVQVIRGLGLWCACLIITWPVSQFYNQPALLWLLPVAGINTLLAGFNSTSIATLNRKIDLGKLTRFEFAIQVITLTVMIIMAYITRSIWALVGGSLVAGLVKMLWSHWLIPGTANRFTWEKEAFDEIFSFGRWIFISTAMTFLAVQADKLILGKLLPLELLGVYIIAFTLADVPSNLMQAIGGKVMFPVMSQYIHLERSSLRAKILHKRWLLLMALVVLVTFLVCFGDLLILALYDQRYTAASWMLPILAIGLWPFLLSVSIDRVLFAIGKPAFVAFGNFLKFFYMIVGLPIGYSLMGEFGAVLVVAFNALPFYLAVSYGLWKEKLSSTVQDIKATLILLGCVGSVLALRYGLGWGFPLDKLF